MRYSLFICLLTLLVITANMRAGAGAPGQMNVLLITADDLGLQLQQIDTPSQRVRTAGYYNAVQRLDDGIGMLVDVLDKHDHQGDTLVIFVGDHGPPFARGKTTVYESGIRVPFLVRWPGVSKSMHSSAMVSTIDILPTILDATGVDHKEKLHGKSLRPVVQDADASWRDYLFAEFHFHGGRPFYPRRAIRNHRYKLIHNLLASSAKPSTGIDGDPAYDFFTLGNKEK